MKSYLTTNDVICAKNARWFWSMYVAHKQFIIFNHITAEITVAYQNL